MVAHAAFLLALAFVGGPLAVILVVAAVWKVLGAVFG